jgi:hypothetical protein
MRFDFGFNRARPIGADEPVRRKVIGPGYQRIANVDNHYLQDREKQRTENYTGMTDYGFGSFLAHDSCATESMGPRFDRSREHLGLSDSGVIVVRRRILDAVKEFQRGEAPLHVVTDPALNDMKHVTSLAEVIQGSDWRTHFPQLVTSVADSLTTAR